MASNYVEPSEEAKFDRLHNQHQHHHHHHIHQQSNANQQQSPSPRSMRRSWSSNSSTCSQGAPPKCVCAPATHAGSFKCRLHRAPSHHSSPPSPSAPVAKPPPAVASSAHRTVEAL